MTFAINRFRQQFSKDGYLRPHSYEVQVAMPAGLTQAGVMFGTQTGSKNISDMSRMLAMRVHECRTPSPTLEWAEVRRYGISPEQEMPFNVKFSDVWFGCVCDKGGIIWNFWHQWMNYIYKFSPRYNAQGGGGFNIGPGTAYTLHYKQDYATNIAIDLYDQVGNLAIEYILNYAFPLSIREIPLSWSDVGNLVEIEVIIGYKDYSVSGAALGQAPGQNQATPPPGVNNPAATQIPFLP